MLIWVSTPTSELLTSVSEKPVTSLKIEAVGLCKTLVNTTNIIWHINPEDTHLHIHHRENLNLV
jgi:hypothetical protein